MKILKFTLASLFVSIVLFLGSNTAQACSFNAAFTGDTMVCAGSSVNYLSKSTSGHFYRWVVKGGILVSGAGTNSIMVNWTTPGKGSVRLIDSTSACKDSFTKTIKVGLTSPILSLAPYQLEGPGSSSVSGKVYTLTTSGGSGNNYTAAWNKYGINLNNNFDFTFITNQNGAADGMMFVLQNKSDSVPASSVEGSDLGYYADAAGNFDESIGVEEDLYLSPAPFADSFADNMSLVMNDNPTPLRKQVSLSNLGAGSDHKLRITWDRDANLFEVYFDGTKEFSWNNDIVKNVFKGNPNVWFGFTAATGGSTATQTIETDTLIYNQAVINSSGDTICKGDSATLTASAGISYNWSTGAQTRSIKTISTGKYTVTVTDSFGCTSTVSDSITVVSLPQVSAAFTIPNSCVGQYVSVTNNTTPKTAVRFSWSFGNGDITGGNPPTYAYKDTGTYRVSVAATNGGCTSTASNLITVYTHPHSMVVSKSAPFQGQFNTGDLYNSDNACVGDTNTYEFSAPLGLSNADYGTTWTIASVNFETPGGTYNKQADFQYPTAAQNASFKFYPGKDFADSTILLTLDVQLLPGNCDTLITRYMNVRPNAQSKFSFDNACLGFPLSFHDSSTIDQGETVSNWNWDFGDSTNSTLQNPKHSYAKPGSYTVTLTATSDAGCGIPVTQTVIEYPEPTVKFGAVPGCQAANSIFTDSSSISSGSLVAQNWFFGDGTSSALQNPSHPYAASGPFNVKLIVTAASGCKDSVTKQIRVQPTPVANFGYRNSCVGTLIIFTNKSIDSSTGGAYKWDFGDGASLTSTLASHTYTNNGTYSVKLTVTSKYGCMDSVVQKITPDAKPTVNFYDSGACVKNAVAFGDTDKNGVGTTYTWDFGDGGSDATSKDTVTHIYTAAGTNKVVLIVQNANGCNDTETRDVVISDYPSAAFTALDVCLGKTTVFNNSSTPGTGLSYLWNFGDQHSGTKDSSSLQNPTHGYGTAGTYSVSLIATNASGCANTFALPINVVATPTVGKWSYSVHNQTVTFTPKDTSQKTNTYKWFFGTGDSSSITKPSYTYPDGAGSYKVTLYVTNSTGCTASYSDSVHLTGAGIPVVGPQNSLNIGIYPNPFEDKTTISYTLKAPSSVNVSVFDIRGKLVAELKNGSFSAGKYQDVFDAGKYNATDGVYLVKMTVNGDVYTGRIVQMK